MTLHMLSMEIDLRELWRLAALQGLPGDEGNALHHGLSESFGKGIVQPFRLMPGRRGSRRATLYAYTSTPEGRLRQTLEETASPEWQALFAPATLRLKTMPEIWSPGRRLAFDVRLRPVRRLLKPLGGGQRKGAEVDAYLVAVARQHPDGRPDTTPPLQREDVYRVWLAERLSGAQILPGRCRLVSFRRQQTFHGKHRGEAPAAIFHGELVITDGNLFAARLAHGIGRHTAYGFGMLLLRPAARNGV